MSDGNHFPASSSAAASCSAAGGWGAGMRGDVQRSRWRAAQSSERYSTGAASGGGQSPQRTVSAAGRPPSPGETPQRYSSSCASRWGGSSSDRYRARRARTGAAARAAASPPLPQRSKTAAFCRPPGQRTSSRPSSRARRSGRTGYGVMSTCSASGRRAASAQTQRRTRRHTAHAATEQPGGGRDSPSPQTGDEGAGRPC